jgi:hypothetical protein
MNLQHKLLPKEAQIRLIQASKVQPTRNDSLARLKAISTTTQQIKKQYPYLFTQENFNEVKY